MNRTPVAFLLLCLLTCCSHLSAQEIPDSYNEKSESELGINELDRIDAMMLIVPGLGSSTREMLKAQNVKSFLMPPRKLEVGARPETYAVTACLEFYVNYRNNYKNNLSPAFLQLITPTAGMDAALRALASSGTVSAAIVPYDARTISPSASATEIFKIDNFLHVVRAEDRSKQKIYQTRTALMRGNPVAIQMRIPKSMRAVKNTRFWAPDGTPATETASFVVVGFDADTEAFELLGMWGNEWGHHGYIWVDYQDFGQLVEDGYVLVPSNVNM